jgi:GDP-mannose pyrophosphatase NudK
MDDDIRILATEVLADDWGVLTKATLEVKRRDGSLQTMTREAYDHGNAATVLLYNIEHGTVVLIRQFRFPLHFTGENPMLIEACAGLLDGDEPAACAKKEAEEETGYRVSHVEHVFDAFMSPGSVTEKLSFFLAEYDADSKIGDGGGLQHEGEDIEVLEMKFADALRMIGTGEITDGKTIMILQHAALAGVFSRT